MSKVTIKRGGSGMPAVVHRNNGSALLSFAQQGSTAAGSPVTHAGGAPNEDEFAGAREWVPWGSDDNFPRSVIPEIRKSTVGRSAIQMLTKGMYGQDLITYKVVDYTDSGQQVMKYTPVPEWQLACRQSNFNAVRQALLQDYNFWSWNVPEIRFNGNKTKVWGFDYHKAANVRFAPRDKKTGMIPKAYISANFPNVKPEDCQQLPVIDFVRYPDQIQDIKDDTKYFKYVMPQMWLDVVNDYYPVAAQDSARSSGNLGIGNSIPAYIAALFKNQMSIKFHIEIPWSWLMEMYPDWKKLKEDAQDDIIDELYNEIVDCLTGAENAEKAILSFYQSEKNGQSVGGWKINAIDDKMREGKYLPNAAAANSETLFAYSVNPATTGQGNTGGDYTGGGNNGGSNIRESLELMRSMFKADRDICYGFFNFFMMYNGLDPEIRLGYQDLQLTTLDTGSNATKVAS